MNRTIRAAFIVSCIAMLGCTDVLDRLVPESLDGRGAIKLTRKCNDADARRLFDEDPVLRAALIEFNPAGISAGVYDYGGITIRLGIARCASADDAYGIYSALTAMPRDRWTLGRGELSYRSPYVSGCNGEYVFWFYSPTNPLTYTGFYKQHGEAMLAEFEKLRRQPDLSYHRNILPFENRRTDSMFYVHSRNVNGIEVTNAYAATYMVQQNKAIIYIIKCNSDEDANNQFITQKKRLMRKGEKLSEFNPMPGAPSAAVAWQETGGTWVLCRYRWMIFLFQDMSSLETTNNFIRLLFKYMAKTRNEALHSNDE